MRHDLTSLKIFVAVAECRNLTRAAEREHLAVSAISKRIGELEAILGTPLLQRYPRGVGLTPAGQSLMQHARQVLPLIERMDAELGEYAGGVKGHDLGGGRALPCRGRGGRAGGRRALRHRLVARLGREGPAPARYPRGAGSELRAHPPLEPGRHGHPAAAPAGRRASADARAPARRPDRDRRAACHTGAAPRRAVPVRVHRADGRVESLQAVAAVETQLEVGLLCDGGVIPSILKKMMDNA